MLSSVAAQVVGGGGGGTGGFNEREKERQINAGLSQLLWRDVPELQLLLAERLLADDRRRQFAPLDEVLCERRGAIINRFRAKFQMESAARFGAKKVTIDCDYFRESIGITSASASERVNFCKL